MPTDLDIEREFADLVEVLREDRAEIRPHFARRLDEKVATGFPREPRWRKLFRASVLVPSVATSMLLALVVGLSSIEMGGDDSGDALDASPGAGEVAVSEPAPQVAEDSADLDGSGQQYSRARRGKSSPQAAGAAPPAAGGGSPSSDMKQARIQETSASLVLGAKPGGVQGVADEIVAVTDRHRGFVLSSSVQATDDGGGASFELRVPSERLKAALADLSRIADVRERREAAQDITREFVSARSRLADARADRRGLLRRLARAANDFERESLKAQLRDVGSRIAAAKTDLARVNNRASYSNISVAVVGDPSAGAVVDDGNWSPGDAAKDAVRVLEVVAGVLLIALAVGLPLALLAALALVLARLMQRRRRERLLDAI